MGMVLLVVGLVWAVIGVVSIVITAPYVHADSTVGAFALLFNVILFVLPGLGLAGLGALLRRRVQSTSQAPGVLNTPAGLSPTERRNRLIALAAVGAILFIPLWAAQRRAPAHAGVVQAGLTARDSGFLVRAPKTEDAAGKWRIIQSTGEMDATHDVTLTLAAEEPISVWLDHPTPMLVIRCKSHQTDLYVVTESAAQPEYGKYNEFGVRVKLDDASPIAQDWSPSTDDKALYAPAAIALARRMAHASTVRFEFTPFNASPAIARFDVRGLAPNLAKVASACGWTLEAARHGG